MWAQWSQNHFINSWGLRSWSGLGQGWAVETPDPERDEQDRQDLRQTSWPGVEMGSGVRFPRACWGTGMDGVVMEVGGTRKEEEFRKKGSGSE